MAVQIQLRRGLATEWSTVNPILAEGEVGIETDGDRFKIGNGINRWNDLKYSGFVSQGNDPSNWNTNTKLGIYSVNRSDWSGTLGSPVDAASIGLLVVQTSGINTVQRYQPTNNLLVTVEFVRTKIGNDDWSPWSQATEGARLDGGTF